MRDYKNIKNYVFGRGAVNDLQSILDGIRSKDQPTVIFLVDDFFKNKEAVKKLRIEKDDVLIFVSSKHEPKSEYIDSLTAEIKQKAEPEKIIAVIGMGGGTVMDIAKCVSIMLTNQGKAEDYQGWDLVKHPGIYKIGIPTVSGTGAESSRTGIFTSPKAKLGMNSNYSMFDQLIMDPDFLETVPKDQFFYTAMDCYIHNIELLHGLKTNLTAKSFAEQSLKLMREVFLNEMDFEKLMLASYLGGLGMATANAAGHICHPVSYGLGTVLGLRHGMAVTLAFNQLGEYYPEETKEFNLILKKYAIELPKKVTRNAPERQFDEMAEATLKNEKPLENAFGEDWKSVFTKEKVKEILKKI